MIVKTPTSSQLTSAGGSGSAITYEVGRHRHLQALAARLPAEPEKLTWPLERLHALRDARLRALVRVAKARSPWHARRLRHIDPDALSGDDLSAIPPMTKTDLMANWDEIVTDPRLTLDMANAHLARVAADGPAYLLDEYHVIASGGTSGTRGVFVWDFHGWLELGLVGLRSVVWLQRQAARQGEPRRAFVMAANATHMTGALARTFAGAMGAGASRSFPVTLPLAEIVAGLNMFDPTHINAYPSMLHRLVEEVRAGRLRPNSQELNCGSEPLLPAARRAIEEAFRLPVANTYASSEAGIMARSFPGSAGLHLNEDASVYEPVDARGRPVSPGTPAARLLVTNVINHALPLIRYALDDQVSLLAEPNPGPWTGRRVADIQGRQDDSFTYAGGVDVHPHVFECALDQRPEIVEYQVRQTRAGADIAVRAASPIDPEVARRELVDALVRLGLQAPQVRIAIVDQLERQGGTGKLRRFIPLAVQAR